MSVRGEPVPCERGVCVRGEPVPRPRGLERVRTLWRLWRGEKEDPAPFYRILAAEAAEELDRRYGPLAGQMIVDLGCGPGFYTEALRALGATVVPVDNDPAEMSMVGAPPEGALLADAGALPLGDASVDGAFCSNLLEHTPAAEPVIRELERVLRPGGWGYVSWTNWYSPWGGHDNDALPVPRAAARPAPLRAAPRPAAQEPLRGGAVGGPPWARRCGSSARDRGSRSSGWSRATGRGRRSSAASRCCGRSSPGTA